MFYTSLDEAKSVEETTGVVRKHIVKDSGITGADLCIRAAERLLNELGRERDDNTCSQLTCDKWNSMGQLNLVVELENEFNVSLEPKEIGEMKSFSDIIMILKSKTSL